METAAARQVRSRIENRGSNALLVRRFSILDSQLSISVRSRLAEDPLGFNRALIRLVHVISAVTRENVGGGGGGPFDCDDRFAFLEKILVISGFYFGNSQPDE